MNDSGCLGWIIGILLFLFVFYLLIVYVLWIVLLVAAVIGAGAGLVVAIKNIVRACKDVFSERRKIGKFKSRYHAIKFVNDGYANSNQNLKNKISGFDEFYNCKSEPEYNAIPQNACFEDLAAKKYIFGPCFKDVFTIIGLSFFNNFTSVPDFSRGSSWWKRVFFVVWSVVELLATYILGTAFTLALSLIMLAVFLVIELVALIFVGIALFFENMFYKIKQITYRCPSCKAEYKTPVYKCPLCGIEHRHLRPGLLGIYKRKCLCEFAVIPVSAKLKGNYISNPQPVIFKISDMRSFCPECGVEHNAGLSKPTSIALIGGASSGKTTFKVAFDYSFINDETVKFGIDVDFPDKKNQQEHEDSRRYYIGSDIISSTNRGVGTDISTFSFLLNHKKFSASRMIHIYDMPGEVFETSDAKEGWRNYQFSEGMVFLIDPFSLPTVKMHSQKVIDSSSMAICQMHMDNLIESLINTLNNENVKKNKGKFRIPVALTINKVDSPLLKKMCGGEAVDILMKNVPEVFTDYFVTMDYVCRCFLAKNGGEGFIANLDNNFETVHFFFSSPMGYLPKASRTPFRPVNVLPIMQWMMLRADPQLGKVWKPETPVGDLTEEQKDLYHNHPEYYDNYVAPLAEELIEN